MATVSHNFVSAIADDAAAAAAGEVLPSHWNATHVIIPNDAEIGVGTYLLTGATIAWVSGYQYSVGAATYYLNGVYTTSLLQTVTLGAAHATLDRIDVLVLDSAGVLSAVAGTAAADPAEPVVDPSVYLRLGIVLVSANTTAPTITTTTIYAENVEWTASPSAGSIVVNSTNNPRGGTKDVEGTAVATNAYVTFTKPAAGTVDLTTQTALVFYIRVKATWAATKSLRVAWYNGTTLRGTNITVGNGQYGFNSANTGVYQQIVIPTSAFLVTAAFPVTTLRITVIGSGTAPGFYIDDIALQAGVATVVLNASRAVVTDVAGSIAVSNTTAAEIGYVSGVTSAIQTQITGKVAKAGDTMTGGLTTQNGATATDYASLDHSGVYVENPTSWSFEGTSGSGAVGGGLEGLAAEVALKTWTAHPINFYTNDTLRASISSAGVVNITNLTASRAVATDGSKNLSSSATTATELGYVSGVTSAIQTQLNGCILVEATSAPTAVSGKRWVDTTTGILYTYSGNSSAWVEWH